MRKLARSQLRAWAQGYAQKEQGGLCPITGRKIDFNTVGAKSDWVVDHCHITGEIRGVLTRGANGMEGKVFNAVARWGGVGNNPAEVLRVLKNLIAYYERPGTGLMYPLHKTAEEKAEATRAKRRVAAATRRATARVKQMQEKQ